MKFTNVKQLIIKFMGGGIVNFPTRFLRWVKINGDSEDDGGSGGGGDDEIQYLLQIKTLIEQVPGFTFDETEENPTYVIPIVDFDESTIGSADIIMGDKNTADYVIRLEIEDPADGHIEVYIYYITSDELGYLKQIVGGGTPTPAGKPWLEGFIINEGLNDVTLDQAFYHKGWAFYASTGSVVPSNFRVLTEEEVQNFTENDIYMCTVIPLFDVELIEEYLTNYDIEIPQADTPVEITYDSYNPPFLYDIHSYYNTFIKYSNNAYMNKLYLNKHTFENGETYYVIYGD